MYNIVRVQLNKHTHMDNLTREQLEDRLAALHQVSLELVKQLSLDDLLYQIAEMASREVDARYAAVGVLDSQGGLEKFIPYGLSQAEIDRIDHPPRGLGLIGQLMHAREPLRIKNIQQYPNSTGFPVNHPEMTSFLGVPIRLGETALGQIYLSNKQSAPEFGADDSQVIEVLASYAAVAISNARLYQDLNSRDRALTRRNQDLALLNDLASTLATSLDIDEILDKSLNRVMGNPQIAVAEIFFSEEDSAELELMHQLGDFEGNLWIKRSFENGVGPIGFTAATNLPGVYDLPGDFERYLKPEVKTSELCQLGCFPLTGRSGSIGVLCLATMPYKYLDEYEIQLFSAIAAWVGTAIENVRLISQSRRLAILEERERIGMDLHDGVIQSIYAVGLQLEHARLLMPTDPDQAEERINQAIDSLNHTIRDIRSYILDLRPRQMHAENLIDGIRSLIEDFRTNAQIEVIFEAPEDTQSNLPQAKSLALFHICQEALANIAKHAHAQQVKIALWRSPDRFLLEIHDDGQGFDQEQTSMTLGHGLANMHTRASNVGGDVEITSDLDEGTTILAWVPYRETH